MKAIIAEKPSVAREIAALLGATQKKEGYLCGNGYMITWALGHLVGLAMPEHYGLAGFRAQHLPILPNPFRLSVRQTKTNGKYSDDSGAVKQLKIIRRVFDRADSIIVATDAGREGELIFRFIYEYLQCKKPFVRLWISSLTEKAIKKGFENLKPAADYDGLYKAGRCRSRADWLVGINASQALSIAAGGSVYSLGRVQTPTLALVCERYLAHKAFKIETYRQIGLQHQKSFTTFKSLSQTKWKTLRQAEEAHHSIMRVGSATVQAVEQKTIKEQPPLLFDLTGLQKEANKRLGLTAEETLNIAQRLYEQKFITYPRTGSRYIPEDLWAEIPGLIRGLTDYPACTDTVERIKWKRFNKHIVNDLKVTDHHGLLVTGKIPTALSARESKVYTMVATRLLEAVSQACIKDTTTITLQAAHYDFTLKGCVVIEPGWREVRGQFSDDKELLQPLPELKTGDILPIEKAEILDKKTKPPVLYTEAGLLSAMETAGSKSEDENERKVLKGIGIGTPATRAATIETLFKRDYVRREKKLLIPTDKGLQVYGWIKDKKIADVSMTAQWEMALVDIENRAGDPGKFQKQIENYAGVITKELLALSIEKESVSDLRCPKCHKQQLILRDKLVKCPDEACRWVQFRNICGVQLTISDLTDLVTHRKTKLIKGMKSRSGKSFQAYIVLDQNGRSSFDFGNTGK